MQTIASLASYGPGAAAVYRSLRPLLESAELAPIALRLTVQYALAESPSVSLVHPLLT